MPYYTILWGGFAGTMIRSLDAEPGRACANGFSDRIYVHDDPLGDGMSPSAAWQIPPVPRYAPDKRASWSKYAH